MRTRLDIFTWTVFGLCALGMWHASTTAAQDSTGLAQCRAALDECVKAARVPADIDVCSEQQARCIASDMHVDVPQGVPVEVLIQCTGTAADCALKAPNADSFYSCTWALTQCIDNVIQDSLSCLDRYNQCVASDPLLLPVCSLELLVCTD